MHLVACLADGQAEQMMVQTMDLSMAVHWIPLLDELLLRSSVEYYVHWLVELKT